MITAADFQIFEDPTLAVRLSRIRIQLDPKFVVLGTKWAVELNQQTGKQFYLHIAKHLRRHKNPPPDTWLALGEGKRGYKMLPHFEIGLWPDALFIWLGFLAEIQNKMDYGQKLIAYQQNLGSSNSGLMLSGDHTQAASVPLTLENWQKLSQRFVRTKNGEFLIGRLIPKDSDIFQSQHKQTQVIDDIMAELIPIYQAMALD